MAWNVEKKQRYLATIFRTGPNCEMKLIFQKKYTIPKMSQKYFLPFFSFLELSWKLNIELKIDNMGRNVPLL